MGCRTKQGCELTYPVHPGLQVLTSKRSLMMAPVSSVISVCVTEDPPFVEKIQDSCNFSAGHILFKHISLICTLLSLSSLPALTLLSCSLSPLPVQEGQPLVFPHLSYTITAQFPHSPNPSVPLMGTISGSSATIPSSSLRTSLHP
ncbi:hypothetical protein INR49_015863 [Caranx melampygus]|nr:hypothetical protein INR49_015863 [Caranx melampygus]